MIDLCVHCKIEYKKRESKRKFCSQLCANRYNRNGFNIVRLPNSSRQLAEFIGICLGDGTTGVYQSAITLNKNADSEYIPFVYKLSKTLFRGAGVNLVYRKDNAVDIRIASKTVVEFLKENGIVPHAKFIPEWILQNHDFTLACIRGLFDTEGSISFKSYTSKKGVQIYKQLNFRNIDIKLMKFVKDNLSSLGLKPTATLKKSLYLSNHESIAIYRQRIGFSNPKLIKKSMIVDVGTYSTYLNSQKVFT